MVTLYKADYQDCIRSPLNDQDQRSDVEGPDGQNEEDFQIIGSSHYTIGVKVMYKKSSLIMLS